MTHLMQALMDFTYAERIPRYIDHAAYDAAKALEYKHLTSLTEALTTKQRSILEKYQEDWEEIRSLELQAMFLAAFSMARELRL